jgi:hypothetical protein
MAKKTITSFVKLGGSLMALKYMELVDINMVVMIQ